MSVSSATSSVKGGDLAPPSDDESRKQITDELIAWIESGKTLREFCRQEGRPSKSVIYRWIDADHDLQGRFARAREIGFEALAEEALAIADDSTGDTVQTKNGEKCDQEWVARARLRVDTRLKLLAKWFPQRYGDAPPKDSSDEMRRQQRLRAAVEQAMDASDGDPNVDFAKPTDEDA